MVPLPSPLQKAAGAVDLSPFRFPDLPTSCGGGGRRESDAARRRDSLFAEAVSNAAAHLPAVTAESLNHQSDMFHSYPDNCLYFVMFHLSLYLYMISIPNLEVENFQVKLQFAQYFSSYF